MHQTCMALTSCYRFMHDENIVAGFRGSEEGYLMDLFQNNFAMRRCALKLSSVTYDD
jgi:hypothetical protein